MPRRMICCRSTQTEGRSFGFRGRSQFGHGSGDLAAALALLLEVETWPKPGLVSHVDRGSQTASHAGTFRASVEVLHPFFVALASAGGAGIGELRAIGLSAEQAMMAATGGVEHTPGRRIPGLGLLCAAAGALQKTGQACRPGSFGTFVRLRWGSAILSGSITLQSHGLEVLRRHGAGGARAEAAAGFPRLCESRACPRCALGVPLPLPGDENAARVHACFALLATLGSFKPALSQPRSRGCVLRAAPRRISFGAPAAVSARCIGSPRRQRSTSILLPVG